MRKTPTKVLDALGSANTQNGGGVCSTDGNIPPIKVRSEKLRNGT